MFDSVEANMNHSDKLDMGVFSDMDSTAFVGAVFYRSCAFRSGIW